jgi:hypothetical protein
VLAAAYHTVKQSAALQLLEAIKRGMGSQRMVGAGAPNVPLDLSKNLGTQVANVYQRNVRILNALAREYGFVLHCFWQPTVFDKPSRSEFEQVQEADFSYLRDFNIAALDALKVSGGEDVVLLSDVFNSTAEPIFIDFCHVGEKGNEMIAEAMLPVVLASADPNLIQ